MLPNIIGPSYNLESRPASVQRSINMVPVPLEPGNERAGWVFKDVPGLVSATSDWAGPPPPAPVLESQTVANLGFASSWSITAPGGIQTGDLLLALVSTYAGGQVPATTSTGWTRIAELNSSSGSGMKSSLFAKIATASNALTVSVNALSNTFGSYIYWRISGCDSIAKVLSSVLEVNSATTSPPFDNFAPGDGLLPRLWLAAFTWSGTVGATVTTFPTGYGTNQQSAPATDTNRQASASSAKTALSVSENPTGMAMSASVSRAQSWVIAIKG
jgi:hypothetical protein